MDPDDVTMEPVSAGDATDVTYLSLNKPIWVYGLRNAQWLLPARARASEQIAFIPLACTAARPGAQPEDDRGRFARAVALFLSESFWFRTGLRALTMVPAVKGTGPSLADHELSQEEIRDIGRSGIRFLVTGTLAEDGLTTELSLTVWDAPAGESLGRHVRSCPRYHLGAMVLELEAELRERFSDVPPGTGGEWYETPGPDRIDGYLGSLARGLTLFMAERQVVPRDQLVGEPNLLQWLSDFALSTTDLPIPPVLFAAGLTADRAMGSDAYQQFREQALALVAREQDPSRPFYRVAPILLQMFGDEQGYADRCATLLETGDAPLLDWLAALEEQPR